MTWYTNTKKDTNQVGNQAGGYQPHHPIKAVRKYFMFELVHDR